MKKQVLLILFVVAVLGAASAQKLVVRSYIERTLVSPKMGTSIGFENKFLWEYGGFFQRTAVAEPSSTAERPQGLPRDFEQEFSGIYFAVPVMVRESYVIKAQVRTGFTNRRNFLITPSVLAEYHLIKHVRLGAGVGMRNMNPTFQGSIALSF